MARHACVSPCCPLQVEGAESQVLSDAFDWSAFTFLSLTVERPGAALRNRLRHHGYLYVGDHGCYGDQLWVPSPGASGTRARVSIDCYTCTKVVPRVIGGIGRPGGQMLGHRAWA